MIFSHNSNACFCIVPVSLFDLGGSALGDVLLGESNRFADAASVLLRDQEEMGKHPHLDVLSAGAETASNVLNAVLSLSVIEYLVEELAWLLVVGVRVLMWVTTNLCVQLLSVDSVLGAALNWAVDRVWLVVDEASHSSCGYHNAITLVVWASDGLCSG